MLHVLVGSNDDDFDLVMEAVQKRQPVKGWVVPKNATIGDLVIMFTRSAGFVCRACVATKPIPGVFGKKQVYRSDVGPVVLFPTSVPLDYVAARLPSWKWATYPRSYTTPSPTIAEDLRVLLEGPRCDAASVEVDQPLYREGEAHYARSLRYDRSLRAREACIRHYGLVCAVCGFAYGNVYGPEMARLITVHHLNPVAAAGEKDIDPIKDMRPVCANCHSVIHRRNPPYTIKEVKAMMAEAV
jgi:hypothetical protein